MISAININLFPSLKDKRHFLAFALKQVNESKSYLHCFTSDVSGKKENILKLHGMECCVLKFFSFSNFL